MRNIQSNSSLSQLLFTPKRGIISKIDAEFKPFKICHYDLQGRLQLGSASVRAL
jgi:hypothetical protein